MWGLAWYLCYWCSGGAQITVEPLEITVKEYHSKVTQKNTLEDDRVYFVRFDLTLSNRREDIIEFRPTEVMLADAGGFCAEVCIDSPATIFGSQFVAPGDTQRFKFYLVTRDKNDKFRFGGLNIPPKKPNESTLSGEPMSLIQLQDRPWCRERESIGWIEPTKPE